MRLIHTSDWHLGRPLGGRKRHQDEEAFLAWLEREIEARQATVLLVAGDIFDHTTPSHQSQSLYYDFLHRLAKNRRCQVVLTAGNHDSPSFLEAPQALLKSLNIQVVGAPAADPAENILVLNDAGGRPGLVVAAAPHLRDRDLRPAAYGETAAEKEKQLLEAMADYYRRLGQAAEDVRRSLGGETPLVVMGHLFTAGGRTESGDGARELYLGSLGLVPADIFPPGADYLALGHLHGAQKVAGRDHWRYSGSPRQLHFSDRPGNKSLMLVDFEGRQARVEPVPAPEFQPLRRLKGDEAGLLGQLGTLKAAQSRAWLEIIYDGPPLSGDLRERLEAEVQGSELAIISCLKASPAGPGPAEAEMENPAELGPEEVFTRCLRAQGIPEAEWPELRQSHDEVLRAVWEDGQ